MWCTHIKILNNQHSNHYGGCFTGYKHIHTLKRSITLSQRGMGPCLSLWLTRNPSKFKRFLSSMLRTSVNPGRYKTGGQIM